MECFENETNIIEIGQFTRVFNSTLLINLHKFIKYKYFWLCKLLVMDGSRYPKICYRRLLYLDSIGICYQNWVSTMRAFFERAGQIGLFHSQSASLIRGSKEIILNALRLSFSRIDYDRAVKSSYCPVYGHLLGHDNWVLGAPMALSRARLLFQLRVQNTRSQTFYLKGRVQRFLPLRFCQL